MRARREYLEIPLGTEVLAWRRALGPKPSWGARVALRVKTFLRGLFG